MNIAFDAGAIEIAKGSGVGNYTLNQFKAMIFSTPENNYYYFNTIGKTGLTQSLYNENFYEINYYMGKGDVIRTYEGDYKELYGQLVKNFLRKYSIDVFYITSPFLAENVIYQREWFEGVTVVGTAYDIIPYIMKDKYLNSKFLMKWYMSCIDMLRWCDRQLAISQSVKDDMVRFLDFDPDKIDIIYGGVNEKYCIKSYSEKEDRQLFKKFGIKNKYIMCGVSADQRKNISGAIHGYAKLSHDLKNEFQLVIVGRVLPEALNQYLLEIDGLGEKDNIILTNYVTDEELIHLYNCAELMLFPSLYEGFGLPLVESWACGTPVAASNNSSLGELAKDAGVLFDPTDVDDIAKALEEALTEVDLNALLEKGRKKLSTFTWDNVAKLTLDAIEQAYMEKKNDKKEKQDKIACVIWDLCIYNKGWKHFFDVLGQFAEVTIFSIQKDNDIEGFIKVNLKELKKCLAKYKYIYHFVMPIMPKKLLEQIKANKGNIVFLDKEILKLVAPSNEDKNQDYEGIINSRKICKYFRNEIEMCEILEEKDISNNILVFDENIKNEIYKKTLERKVFNISSKKSQPNQSVFSEEDIELIAKNLLEAGMRDADFYSAKQWADKLLEEIIKKEYSEKEIRYLSHTLADATSTEPGMKRKEAFISKEEKKLQVAMVTTWNTKCGIAEFTRYFMDNTLNEVEYVVFPDISEQLVREDESFVAERTWQQYNLNFENLIQKLQKSPYKIIHIQYNFGFFSLENVAKLIDKCPEKYIIIDFHATKMIEEALTESSKKKVVKSLNNAYKLVVHQKQDIDQLNKVGVKNENIEVIPLGQNVCRERTKEQCREWLGIKSNHIIGSYGFMLPHKGIEKVIEAVGLLKQEYPDILYIVNCALYEAEVSKQYLLQCKQLVEKLRLEKNIIFINDFLSPEESELILQSCDLLAMVYSPTGESASGAIRFCMSARRPIITTKQKIFSEYAKCTFQIESNEALLVADACRMLFKRQNDDYVEKITQKINETSWSVVGNKYINLYKNIGQSVIDS